MVEDPAAKEPVAEPVPSAEAVAPEPAPQPEPEPEDLAPQAGTNGRNGGLGRGLASLISPPSEGRAASEDSRRRWADVHPIGNAATAEPRIRIVGVEVDTDSLRTTVRVRLAADGVEVVGEALGPAGRTAVLRLVGEATLKAVEKLGVMSGCYAVEDCSVVTLAGRGVAVCSIVTVTSEGEQALSGSAVVRHTAESATSRATLDALNRRLGL